MQKLMHTASPRRAVVMEAAEPHGAVRLARTYFVSNGGAATRMRTFDWDGQEEEVTRALLSSSAHVCLMLSQKSACLSDLAEALVV